MCRMGNSASFTAARAGVGPGGAAAGVSPCIWEKGVLSGDAGGHTTRSHAGTVQA